MASKNYQKGYRFEYRTRKYLERLGWYVIRAYRSWGIFDLVAVPPQVKSDPSWHNIVMMIQCKTNGYVKPSERKTLEESATRWNGLVVVASSKKRKIHFQIVTPKGDWLDMADGSLVSVFDN